MAPARATAAHRIAGRQRQHDGEDDRRERGIRPQHQDAAGPEHRVGQQRHDRRVEPVDARQARRDRVGDADRHQHGRQHEPGHEVVAQPGRFVARATWPGPGSQRIPRAAAVSCRRGTAPRHFLPGGSGRRLEEPAPDPTPMRSMIAMASTMVRSSGRTRSAVRYITLPTSVSAPCAGRRSTSRSSSASSGRCRHRPACRPDSR